MKQQEVFNLAKKYADMVAPQYGVDANKLATYLTGIARVESNFNPAAKNKSSTARGLMQILICTQREIEAKRAKVQFPEAMYPCKSYKSAPVGSQANDKVFNAEYALFLAAHELAYQYKRYVKKYPTNTWQIAVHAYNQGSYPGSRKGDGQKYSAAVFKHVGSNDNFASYFGGDSNRQEYY